MSIHITKAFTEAERTNTSIPGKFPKYEKQEPYCVDFFLSLLKEVGDLFSFLFFLKIFFSNDICSNIRLLSLMEYEGNEFSRSLRFCDHIATKLGFHVWSKLFMYDTRQYKNIWKEHRHWQIYRLHHYVCVTSVLYICHKEKRKPVIIFILDWQINV